MRQAILIGSFVLLICAIGASGRPTEDETLPLNYAPSGKLMFKEYCAACHGADAKGEGPLASFLKMPPANLTTLSKRHGGKFPRDYVSSVLQFGSGPSVHGSSDMPTWGPIFEYYDKNNERVVQQRIKSLCDYLASLQEN
jgi:mono/diheme cytochrome c family protein